MAKKKGTSLSGTAGTTPTTTAPSAPYVNPGAFSPPTGGSAAEHLYDPASGGKTGAPDAGKEEYTGQQPPQYLGVPSPRWEQNPVTSEWELKPGYARVVQNQGGYPGVPGQAFLTPKYYEGDEFALVNGLGLSPEARAAIQARMAQAGLMPKQYNIGRWDADSVDAFKQVLTYANQTTQDWQTALDDLVAGGQAAGLGGSGSGGGGPVFTAHLSNPDDIKKAYKDVRYQLLGGQFTDDTQADAFVTTFQSQELAAQRASFDAQVGGGGEIVDAPNMGTAAETQLEATDEAGIKAKRYLDFTNVLGNILGQKSPTTNAA